MRARVVTVASAVLLGMPGLARAAELVAKPMINWIFVLSLLVFGLFLLVAVFSLIYYLVAVASRNRRLASGEPVMVIQSPSVPEALAARSAPVRAAAPVAAPAGLAAAPAPAAVAPSTPAPTPSAPTAAPAPAAAPAAAAPAPAASAPAVAGDIPKVDPVKLPAGIDAVARGRLKKLAVFQERGQQPPADLVEHLRPILDEMIAAGAPPAAAAAPASAPVPSPAPAPAKAAPAAAAAAPAAPTDQEAPPAAEVGSAPAPAAASGDIPRVDPLKLPEGIDAVTRGRLKKLAVLQERGQAPPADLVENLRGVLEQMKGV